MAWMAQPDPFSIADRQSELLPKETSSPPLEQLPPLATTQFSLHIKEQGMKKGRIAVKLQYLLY